MRAELRQVAAEHVVLVHAAELVHDAARLLQDLQGTAGARPDRAASAHRCRAARATARAACARSCRAARGAASSAGSSRGSRAARARTGRLARASSSSPRASEALVQRARRRCRAGAKRASQVLQQDGVELRDRLRGAVVALHQRSLAARASGCRRSRSCAASALLEVERRCGPRAARRGSAGGCAGPAACASWRASCARFAASDQAAARQVASSCCPMPQARAIHRMTCRSRRPPGASFEVGLERVGRVLVLGVALLLLELLRLEERRRIDALPPARFARRAKQRRAAGEQARLEQRWSRW